jgi:hypothetical protein
MAQIVKLEPDDVLVLANVGADVQTIDELNKFIPFLREILNIEHVLVFCGDVDLSKLPPGWTPPSEAGSGDGG